MVHLIAVIGSSPGVGKSTVCRELCRLLGETGHHVDHFEEEHILQRPEFARVASAFYRTGFVAPDVFLADSVAYVRTLLDGAWDVAVTDALFPFIPSLRAFGLDEDEIAGFLCRLRTLLAPLDPVLVYLDDDAATALGRAAAREEPGWTDWFVVKVAGYRNAPEVHDVDTAAAYLQTERELTLRLLRDTGWQVEVICAAEPTGVRNRLTEIIRGFPP